MNSYDKYINDLEIALDDRAKVRGLNRPTLLKNRKIRDKNREIKARNQEMKVFHPDKYMNDPEKMEIANQIVRIYNESHIFILACVTANDGQQEGIPNVLKEAMACGLPVVSTYHSGIDELVVDNEAGFLAPEKDVEALVGKLRYLIEHPKTWAETGQNARAAVEENFNSKRLSETLESIYNGLLTGVRNE